MLKQVTNIYCLTQTISTQNLKTDNHTANCLLVQQVENHTIFETKVVKTHTKSKNE